MFAMPSEIVDGEYATAFTSDATRCPAEYAGKLSFDANADQRAGQRLFRLSVEIATITSGNLLLRREQNELLEAPQIFPRARRHEPHPPAG